MARRARRDVDVVVADSQREACTGKEPYGVVGEMAERRKVWRVLKKGEESAGWRNGEKERERETDKCLDSSRAIFVKSEKMAGGRSGWDGPKRAMMSQLPGRDKRQTSQSIL